MDTVCTSLSLAQGYKLELQLVIHRLKMVIIIVCWVLYMYIIFMVLTWQSQAVAVVQ